MTRKITIGLLLSVAAILIGWDIYMYKTPTPDDTISQVFLYFSSHPILPFAVGTLCGHLFWAQTVLKNDSKR